MVINSIVYMIQILQQGLPARKSEFGDWVGIGRGWWGGNLSKGTGDDSTLEAHLLQAHFHIESHLECYSKLFHNKTSETGKT